MNFYENVKEYSNDFNEICKNLESCYEELKENWKGPASLKFFSNVESITEILNTLKTHFSLYEAAGIQLKVLEEVTTNIDKKSEEQAALEEPNLDLNKEIKSLEIKKKQLIKEIEEYFDTISDLDRGSLLSTFLHQWTIKKADRLIESNKDSSKNTEKDDNSNKNGSNGNGSKDGNSNGNGSTNGDSSNNSNSNGNDDSASNSTETPSIDYESKVGTVIANVDNYNNDAARGQCVWYVRGRAVEKLGKDTGAVGNGNQMAINCKKEAQLAANKENIKDNIIVSYRYGTSSAGQKYGHVIYIEKVIGDKVYYSECASGGKPAGTLKETTKDAIINGTVGCGTVVVGFIDVAKL